MLVGVATLPPSFLFYVTLAFYFINRPSWANISIPSVQYTANIFKVIFTVFNCVRLSTVVSLYGLHLIAAPITIR